MFTPRVPDREAGEESAVQQVALGSGAQALVRAGLDCAGPPVGGQGDGLGSGSGDGSSGGQLALRTGVFVVDPPFFGNGDVGRAAVCGVVNELAATGAEPLRVALGVIVEAGLPVRLLRRLVRSIREAAREAGVAIAAVDTEVVRAGEADQVFVTATAFGLHRRPAPRPTALRPGDRIVVTGPLGDHAAHLLTLRGAPGLEQYVDSDCAPWAGCWPPCCRGRGTPRRSAAAGSRRCWTPARRPAA